MDQHELPDFDINEVESYFLPEIAIIDNPDIPLLYLQHFCRNRNTHR
jgi:hypothetical protein